MKAKTIDELKKLSEAKLFEYFSKHARYHKQAPSDAAYSIRIGSKSLFSSDTRELRDKFEAAVKTASL